MMNPAAFSECLHMTVAAYAATGFIVGGIHAFKLLRSPDELFHRYALVIALTIGGTTAILQPLTGDIIARAVARNQPSKLAAFEGHYETATGVPLVLAGPVRIPRGLSLLAFHNPNALVKGLNDFPKDQWPPVAILRPAFQIMVAAGFAMAFIAMYFFYSLWRNKQAPDNRWFLRTVVAAAPLGFLVIECGWVVTEVGRQPWIIMVLP
jgi:cytochrome d ubiquinol oxidase subunit I